MGTVASIYRTDTVAKVVLFGKRRRGFLFKESLTLQPGEYVFPQIYLSYFYPDLVSETIRIPPVKDEGTKEILIRRKLADALGLKGSYLIVFQELPEESTPAERAVRVFALPEEVYRNENILPRNLEENLMLFTTPHFSLLGISGAVAGDRTVLHAFADEESLVTTVSRGTEILYTRSLRVPPYTRADEEAYTDFIYENLNMTYMFVAQRSSIPVDLILLSGKLYDKERLVERLLSFVNCGLATPLVPIEFRDVGPIVFLEFLPCFGNVLLDQEWDFSPREVKERRSLKLYISRLVPLLALLLVLSLSLLCFRLYGILEKSEEVAQLRGEVFSSLSAVSGDPFLRGGDLGYYVTYLNLLSDSRRENPLALPPEIGDLLAEIKAKDYLFSYTKGKVALSLSVEERFGSLSELSLYREKLLKRLEEMRRKGLDYRIESEEKDLKENRLLMKIVLEKKV